MDAVDMAYEIFVKEVSVTLSKSSDLRIFFHHDFHVNGNEIGDTVLYDPFTSPIIHYIRKIIEDRLSVNGGIIRYEKDSYLKVTDKPNIWYIATLWLAQQSL